MTQTPDRRNEAFAPEDVRLLHRLDVRDGATGEGDANLTRIGIAVDVETTSTVHDLGAVIELAMRRFRFDACGIITHVGELYEWLEDPGAPLTEETTAITGLVDSDLQGHRIDDVEAAALLRSASIVVAHHAAFDRPFVERRLPEARGLAWACSFRQVDWRARGFDGRTLGYLLQQAGYFNERHRAGADVDALIQLLRHGRESGRTVLAELVERSALPSWIVRAQGAPFETKDVLKARGYRWDSAGRYWWTEVQDDALAAEETWLAGAVYARGMGAGSRGPQIERVSAAERFS